MSRYARTAYAVALAVTRRHEDAEDAVQESFVAALERLDACRNPERFGGWLLTIVRNRSRNVLRRERIRTSETLAPGLAGTGPGPDRETERSELRERLDEALEGLTEVQREVVLLHDLEGWKHREIADMLGLPSGTVRSHLHHARRRLRERLALLRPGSDSPAGAAGGGGEVETPVGIEGREEDATRHAEGRGENA